MMERVDPNLRHKIKVTEGFVPPALCEEILLSIDSGHLCDAVVNNHDASGTDRVDKTVRNVLVHEITAVEKQINDTFQRIVDQLIEPFYGVRIEGWEQPGIL